VRLVEPVAARLGKSKDTWRRLWRFNPLELGDLGLTEEPPPRVGSGGVEPEVTTKLSATAEDARAGAGHFSMCGVASDETKAATC
jgi:hypothetical protein